MNDIAATTLDTTQGRSGGRVCTICTHAARVTIEAELAEGRSLRDVAGAHGVSVTALHRHRNGNHTAVKTTAETAPGTEQPVATEATTEAPEASQDDAHVNDGADEPVTAVAPPPTAPEAVVAGCSVCSHTDRRWVDVALRGSAAPDVKRIAKNFGVSEVSLREHWDHLPHLSPPMPVRPLEPDVKPVPALTMADARRLLEQDRNAIVKARIAGLAAYQAARAREGAPVAFLDWKLSAFRRAMVNLSEAEMLVAVSEVTAFFTQPQKTLIALAGPPPVAGGTLGTAGIAFSAPRFVATLAARGVTLRVTPTGGILARLPDLMNGTDRRLLTQHHEEIAKFISTEEEFNVVR